MKALGWAFFALAVAVVAGYALNRGIYVGSDVRGGPFTLSNGQTVFLYRKHCRYLHLSGISEDDSLGEQRRIDAEKFFCRMFER